MDGGLGWILGEEKGARAVIWGSLEASEQRAAGQHGDLGVHRDLWA